MYKEPTKKDLNKLAKIRGQFGDYIECLQMIFAQMPEHGKSIRLNSRIICSEVEDVRESFHVVEWNKGISDPVEICTIDGIKWFGIESQLFFLIYNEDYSKNYYLTL